MGFFTALDIFKVQQSFYLYNQEKEGKKRKYSVLYGSILGVILTFVCFTILSFYLYRIEVLIYISFYLYSLARDMLSGRNDKLT